MVVKESFKLYSWPKSLLAFTNYNILSPQSTIGDNLLEIYMQLLHSCPFKKEIHAFVNFYAGTWKIFLIIFTHYKEKLTIIKQVSVRLPVFVRVVINLKRKKDHPIAIKNKKRNSQCDRVTTVLKKYS